MSTFPPVAQPLAERITGGRPLRLRDVAFRVYLVALFGPPAVVLVAQLVDVGASTLGLPLPLTDPAAPALVRALLAGLGAAAMLLWAHTAAWRAPVTLVRPDVPWLLAAPRPRAELLRPRLVRALVRAAGIGAAGGAAVALLAADALGGLHLLVAAAGGVGGAGLAAALQAAAWWVVCAAPRSRTAVRLTPAAGLGVAVLVAGAGIEPVLGHVLAWSGPWGWPAVGVVAAATGAVGAAALATALSAVAGGLAAGWALRQAAAPPVEELARRTGVGAGAHAAIYLYDVGGLLEVRRDALDLLRGPPRLRLPRPRRPPMAVPWRDATALLRSPGRTLLGVGVMLLAGALAAFAGEQAVLARVDPGAPVRAVGLAVGAAVAAQMAASVLADPLRSALARPFGHAHLPWPHAALVRRHTFVSAAALVLAGLGGVAVAVVAGGPAVQPWPAVLAVGLAVPVLTGAAAHACLRPPQDPHAVFEAMMTETGVLAQGMRSWPAAVILVVLLAPAGVAILGVGQLAAGAVAAGALAWGLAAGGVVWWLLDRRGAPWSS